MNERDGYISTVYVQYLEVHVRTCMYTVQSL